jgi:hypothetical protein
MLKLAGEALMVKSGVVAVTVTVTVVLCVAAPSVPVTVTVYEPATTEHPALTVSVELLPAATEAGLSEAVGPAGLTLAVRFTVPLPPMAVVEMVLVPLPPCAMLTLAGLAEMEKSGGVVTVTVTVAVWVVEPSVPVTVTV